MLFFTLDDVDDDDCNPVAFHGVFNYHFSDQSRRVVLFFTLDDVDDDDCFSHCD
jgi:hypothetical protein